MALLGTAAGLAAGFPLQWYTVRILLFAETGTLLSVHFPWATAATIVVLMLTSAVLASLGLRCGRRDAHRRGDRLRVNHFLDIQGAETAAKARGVVTYAVGSVGPDIHFANCSICRRISSAGKCTFCPWPGKTHSNR